MNMAEKGDMLSCQYHQASQLGDFQKSVLSRGHRSRSIFGGNRMRAGRFRVPRSVSRRGCGRKTVCQRKAMYEDEQSVGLFVVVLCMYN
jgi:hypothetical protein